MDAAEAIARARAVAARLAGTGAVADYSTNGGAPSAAPSYGSAGVGVGGAADVNSLLDAAFSGGAAPAPASSFNPSTYGPASAVATTNGSADTKKRGVEEALASLIPGLGATAADSKRPRTAGTYECTKKLWIPSDRNPGYNYVGLLIGPGGSKQRELVAASGGDVKISIRGKGSSSKESHVPGMPEEPLHVLLEGSTECVTKAEVMVRELLEDSEAADKEKARQLSIVHESTDGATGGYTPKPVAQILGLGTGSTPASAYGPQPGEEQVEEKIGVPNGIVGLIIGRGGESITSMQRRTGCRVQIQKEHEMAPGTTQRVITLTASTAEAIAQCRAIIESMVKERLAAVGSTATTASVMSTTSGLIVGPGSNAAAQMAQLQKALAEGQSHVTVQVPDADVGLIIGKGGAQIRNIQEKSGANVQIPQVADAGNPAVRTVNITHPNAEGANFAKQMIEEVLATKVQNAAAGGGNQEVTIQVNCPDKDVGMIIGRGGCVIKQMQSSTRCRIQIPPTAPPGSMYRVISVIGNAAGCQQVKQMIETIIAEQSSQSVMSGVGFATNPYGQQQAYGQQNYYGAAYGQQQTAAYGQQAQKTDYSAEWAAYYAAQAAAQGSATTAVAPTPAATTTTAAAATGETPAFDAYYEVFWQYAAYYGEEAARKYYGEWSPPEGTPNPNAAATLAGATSAAAPAPATTEAATVDLSSQQGAEIKDSSVRKVSNLPAWMNKN